MRSLQQWLDTYGQSHQHPTNIAIHKVCVPAIVFAVLGLCQAIPGPINIAWLVYGLGLLFYLRLSWSMMLAMGVLCGTMLVVQLLLQQAGVDVTRLSLLIFVIAWIGQFIGHKIEGKKPSFFQDIQFLMIGPAWTLAPLLRRLHLVG